MDQVNETERSLEVRAWVQRGMIKIGIVDLFDQFKFDTIPGEIDFIADAVMEFPEMYPELVVRLHLFLREPMVLVD